MYVLNEFYEGIFFKFIESNGIKIVQPVQKLNAFELMMNNAKHLKKK